ncbi:drug resistance transporter, EmrB/QacA subfamily [Streptomyces sp. SceaMP-e96]|uniref:MFS transporter n=1 Tax=unclassified Streptomyces TaxID=2593676 RepID=UPI000823ED08|nr:MULTISPECIES: MFS transporter [unclassified Streptomyces]MYT14314.1 MFS transporter [Streptomyces sp. SID4951]SCK59429.1 drug resistance transporter, EmrB/QacA subfamily [Streptomyces sp. SceaMP-e96]
MRKWLPLVATCLGTFMLLVYSTIVTVALPSMAHDLHASFGSLQWIVDVYTLALAGLLLGMGSLGDNLGRKRLYLAGLGIFAVATLVCGLAGDVTVLIAARAVQGLAGAAMFSTLLPLIGLTYSGRDKGVAFAVWGAVAGAAAGIGNVAGGVLTQFLSWQWIFFGGVPVCAITVLLSAAVLIDDASTSTRIDYLGIVTFTLAAIGITFGIIRGGEQGWGATSAVLGFVAGLVMLIAFVLVERTSSNPMISLDLFRKQEFNGTLVAAMGYYLAGFGALPVMSIWLQDSVGLTSLPTALVITVQPVAFFATSAMVGSALHRLPSHWTLGGGTVTVGLGNVLMLTVDADSSWAALVPGLILTGIGAGIVSPVLPAIAMSAAPESQSGVASAAANCARQLGLALGIAVLGSVFHQFSSGTGGGDLHVQYASGLSAVFVVAAVVGLGSGLLALWLLKERRPAAQPA